jgi:hypothetical protein
MSTLRLPDGAVLSDSALPAGHRNSGNSTFSLYDPSISSVVMTVKNVRIMVMSVEHRLMDVQMSMSRVLIPINTEIVVMTMMWTVAVTMAVHNHPVVVVMKVFFGEM